MTVLVSGASGFVGAALIRHLAARGDAVRHLVRAGPVREDRILWEPPERGPDPAQLEGLGAVVHLAGENIAGGRWTQDRKRRIRESRVGGTRVLCEALAATVRPPRVLIVASATGYYGDQGEAWVDETAGPSEDFLGQLARDWEGATEPAVRRGIRVVVLRMGVVLGPGGGALRRMAPVFRWGFGGRLGSGRQYWSWISLEDLVRVVQFCLDHDRIQGPVNATAPAPVTNGEFTRELSRAVRRPAVLPVPALALRLALGGLAESTLLVSQRVRPARLLAEGFEFVHPTLGAALGWALGRPFQRGPGSGKL